MLLITSLSTNATVVASLVGRIHLILPKNTDVPVAAARTIGQGMAIAVGVLSAKGMPVHNFVV